LLEERGLSGEPSPPVGFKTKATQPDKPLPPRLVQRLKTALVLRLAAPTENGSRVVAFHLELQRDLSAPQDLLPFVEVYSGPNRQARVNHLLPSTLYRFRLAASNQHGKRFVCAPSAFQQTSCMIADRVSPLQLHSNFDIIARTRTHCWYKLLERPRPPLTRLDWLKQLPVHFCSNGLEETETKNSGWPWKILPRLVNSILKCV